MKQPIHLVEEGYEIWNETAKVYVRVSSNNAVFAEDGVYFTKEHYERLIDSGRLFSKENHY